MGIQTRCHSVTWLWSFISDEIGIPPRIVVAGAFLYEPCPACFFTITCAGHAVDSSVNCFVFSLAIMLPNPRRPFNAHTAQVKSRYARSVSKDTPPHLIPRMLFSSAPASQDELDPSSRLDTTLNTPMQASVPVTSHEPLDLACAHAHISFSSSSSPNACSWT